MKKYIIPVLLFLVLFFGSASYTKQRLIERYNRGIQYYDSGDYEAAMEIFSSLFGWGTGVDISPEEYYDMASSHLFAERTDIIKCPHCGLIIEVANE